MGRPLPPSGPNRRGGRVLAPADAGVQSHHQPCRDDTLAIFGRRWQPSAVPHGAVGASGCAVRPVEYSERAEGVPPARRPYPGLDIQVHAARVDSVEEPSAVVLLPRSHDGHGLRRLREEDSLPALLLIESQVARSDVRSRSAPHDRPHFAGLWSRPPRRRPRRTLRRRRLESRRPPSVGRLADPAGLALR